uniref:Ran gtpase-activating protein n=1 Tax=Rhipicephalus appendiculatus TaxID=34631 RepID=A0A131YTU1_RHIAP
MTAEKGEAVEGLASEDTAANGNAPSYPEQIVARLTKRGLDFERACEYDDDKNDAASCWLRHDLDRWSRVLHPVSLELEETKPGALAILSTRTSRREYSDEDELYDAAYVFCWLPKAHRCVQRINLETLDGQGMVLFYRPAFTLALSLGRSVNLQQLELVGGRDTPFCEEELSEGLNALQRLRSFKFASLPIKASMSRCMANVLSRNASHLTAVTLSDNRMSQNTANRLLRALQRCRALRELSIVENNLTKGNADSVARLLRFSYSLTKLTLDRCLGNNASLYAFTEALKTSIIPLELHINQCETRFECLFEALANNRVALKHLNLNGCNIFGSNAEALGAALRHNVYLKKLELNGAHVDNDAVAALARGLETNRVLETLDLRNNAVSANAINTFCRMLRKNETLKSVMFSEVQGTEQERLTLSFQMAQDKGYSRIQMPWAEPDLPPLSAALALASESPTELHLSDINELTEGSICALLENLATNGQVKTVKVETTVDRRQIATALCSALVSNRAVQDLEVGISIDASDQGLFGKVAKALATNRTVTQVCFKSSEVSLRSLKSIAYMLSKNTAVTRLELVLSQSMPTKRLAIVSRGLLKNHSIVHFTLTSPPQPNHVSFRIFSTLRRNISLLNLAVSLLTRRRLNRQVAETFELLSENASFVPYVMKVTEKTEERARWAVKSAKVFIQAHYFELTGVVKRKLECHPGTGTQIDSLHSDCLCAITQYLKLSDVVSAVGGSPIRLRNRHI